jgi:ABC-type sulfate transport system substrate-binding protein
MATGRLGTTVPAATTLTTVYTVPSSNYSVFNVSFTNTNATTPRVLMIGSNGTTTLQSTSVINCILTNANASAPTMLI